MKRPFRVIFLVESYFQDRDYMRFGVDRLQDRGYSVEIWQVFPLWKKNYARAYTPPDPSRFRSIETITSRSDLKSALKTIGLGDVVLALVPENRATGAIFRKLARDNIYYGELLQASPAGVEAPRRPLLGRSARDMLESVYVRLPRWLRRTTDPRFAFLCGGTDLAPVAARHPRAEAIWGHALDYDLALRTGGTTNRTGGGHIVFLDQYLPFHPDFIGSGMGPPIEPGCYFSKLQRLFKTLESSLQQPVVIAAHPRMREAQYMQYFPDRRIERGRTCELIRDSTLVVTHYSTANNFTAIYRKPALVITTDELNGSLRGCIDQTARNLGVQVHNVDDARPLAMDTLLCPNLPQIALYLARIVKRPGTPEMNNWDILADHLSARAFGCGATS